MALPKHLITKNFDIAIEKFCVQTHSIIYPLNNYIKNLIFVGIIATLL